MTRAAHNAQMERMAEKLARLSDFQGKVNEILTDYKGSIARPCPACATMIYPGEKCPICRRGKE